MKVDAGHTVSVWAETQLGLLLVAMQNTGCFQRLATWMVMILVIYLKIATQLSVSARCYALGECH